MAQDNDLATSEQSEISTQRTKTSQPARSSEGKTMAMVQPGEPVAQIPPASKATRVLDPEEIKLLMKQGQQFIAAGDVVTARAVFQRAAEAGDADAAVALGGTYDPIVFAKLGVAGLGADVEKARTWYQKAESLGSAEATRRLAILANRERFGW
jgi:TPR repeat protein